MIKVSKNICFKIIGSHHTLNIIVIVKLSGLRLIQKLLNNFSKNLLNLNIRGYVKYSLNQIYQYVMSA